MPEGQRIPQLPYDHRGSGILFRPERKYARGGPDPDIAMDFWASLDHQMKYKKDVEDASEISEELKECAEVIAQTDLKMLSLRRKIEDRESKENLLQFDKDPM